MNLFATQPHASAADGGPNSPDSPAGSPASAATARFFYATGSRPLQGYTIKRGIGHGGFGEVYYATSDAGKEVALKLIRRNWDVELRGVMHCLNLKHPNLLSLYDVRQDAQGDNWVVMELMSGESLEEVIARNPNGLPLEETLAWIHGIAAGVAYLHDHGIVHRDLKPGNIFVDEGFVKIGDYGLSKFISCSRRSGQTGSVGTVHYMAPEIAKGRYGKEIDIYALGIILYEMLTGHVPFEGESVGEILMKHLTAEPDTTKLAEPYRTIVSRTLAKDPANRFTSVDEMIALLPPVPSGAATGAARFVGPNSGVTATPSAAGPAAQASGFSLGQIIPPPLPPGAGQRNPNPSPAGAPFSTPARVDGQRAQAANPSPGPNANQGYDPWYREAKNDLTGWWERRNFQPWQKILITGVIIIVALGILNDLGHTSGSIHASWLNIVIIGVICYAVFHKRDKTNRFSARAEIRYPQPPPVASPFAGRQAVGSPPVGAAVPVDFTINPPPLPQRESPTRKRWKFRSAQPLYQPGTPRERITQLIGSMILSTIIALIVSLVAIILRGETPDSSQYAWLAASSVVGSWAILTAAKFWEGSRGDPALRRFVMLAIGLGFGAVSFGLLQWTMSTLPFNASTNLTAFAREFEGKFFDSTGPKMIAFLAYFGFLFLTVRWWRFADPIRGSRLNIWNTTATVLWSWLLSNMFLPFPEPWGLMLAITIAISVQLSSPWLSLAERAELPRPSTES